MFGLVRSAEDSLTPTERAHAILSPVMPEDETNARLDAFLAVPLFKAVFEKYKGQALPPPVGIKNLLKTHYGIVEERVGPALRILMDSADSGWTFPNVWRPQQDVDTLGLYGRNGADAQQARGRPRACYRDAP